MLKIVCWIIWYAFHGKRNDEISKIVGLDCGQVGVWRRRWKMSFDALVAIECRECQAQMVRSIEEVLSDAPRSRRPPTFTLEQVTQILAVACENPGLPMEWRLSKSLQLTASVSKCS